VIGLPRRCKFSVEGTATEDEGDREGSDACCTKDFGTGQRHMAPRAVDVSAPHGHFSRGMDAPFCKVIRRLPCVKNSSLSKYH